jgi:hypothetical protein
VTQPTSVLRVNPIHQASPIFERCPLGEETLLFNERVDEALRGSMHTLSGIRVPQFTPIELRQLEVVHVDVPKVYVLVEPDSSQLFIQKRMQFDNLEELKFFLRDYSVRHHMLYNVIHSSAKIGYTVACQQGCD